MFVLLIRGLTLDGASQGIRYYLMPNMEKLLESKVCDLQFDIYFMTVVVVVATWLFFL